jgi:uncharacterized protein
MESEQPTPPAQRSLADLKRRLRDLSSAVIAFSGGVDSTLLLRVAADTRGFRFAAVTTVSPTTPPHETDEARALAESIGAAHRVIAVNELETPGYATNPPTRCYLCKQTLYPRCRAIADDEGYSHVIDGVNVDDLGDYRPGLLAARLLGVLHPLADAGLTKRAVRELSRWYGLPTADKPASPCLSSRFPYGTRITEERLKEVATAETAMRRLGFRELRVRHLGHTARVEVAAEEHGRLTDDNLRREVLRVVSAAGFDSVEISPVPFRSGSLNDVLADRVS